MQHLKYKLFLLMRTLELEDIFQSPSGLQHAFLLGFSI